ncbi:hypothetical protein FRB93_000437 [Tulasnella sp. JGI-2019a]|nr:hypothetical protein FRB93_000437 [Tulasnella sp. JGI-2019a]
MIPTSPLPPPLPPHVFAIILQYLLPPSPPVPQTLLSTALLQRHYFLSIDHHNDPASYFLLPKDEPDIAHGIVLALEEIGTYDVDHAAEEIEYLVDSDDRLMARVGLMSQLQVVFVLESRTEPKSSEPGMESAPPPEESTEWRYHDVIWRNDKRKVVGYATVETALASQNRAAKPAEGEENTTPVEQTADEFWDGWDEPETTAQQTNKGMQADVGDSDDQYYARYADVEPIAGAGPSGDETIINRAEAPEFKPSQVHVPTRVSQNDALKSVVRGAYTLWESSSGLSVAGQEERKRAFLSLVTSVVREL